MSANIFTRFKSFYFIGMGGVSMSALAEYVLSLKKKVGGSDRDLSALAKLKSMGAETDGGPRVLENYEVIIYTDAVRRDDPELKLARKLNKLILSRGRFLKEVSSDFGRVIAVCGCHGKTTTTAMLASVFRAAGKKFGAHIGGNAAGFGNFYCNGNDFFITEACEYKKNFLYLRPDTAVVLNTDSDHLECYKGEEDLKNCYRRFASRAQTAVVPYKDDLFLAGSDKNKCLKNLQTFGGRGADFYAENVCDNQGFYSFELNAFGKNCGKISLTVPGGHNVNNALAVAAAAMAEGINFECVKRGLEEFEGVERRMQMLGRINGARYVADYAHHPSEISASLKTAQAITRGRLYVVFQPHTYSRTKNLFPQFVSVLSGVRRLLIYRTYAAREYFDDGGSALTLAKAVGGSRYGDRPEDIIKFASSAKDGDTVLFLGAGDIYFIARSLISDSVKN